MSKLFNRFSQNSGKVAYGSWKKPLDFSGNLGVDLVQDFFLWNLYHLGHSYTPGGWLCLVNSVYTCGCKQLPVLQVASYVIYI